MAVVAQKIIHGLQMLGALVLIITGILDRLKASDRRDKVFLSSYIVSPVLTGALIAITAGCGLVVKAKVHLAPNSALVLVYKSLNITTSVLCFFILFRYGEEYVTVKLGGFALKENGDGLYYYSDDPEEDRNLPVLKTISAMALTELFLSIFATLAFQDGSSHTQLVDFPVEPYNNQKQPQVPPVRVLGNNFVKPGTMEAGFQT